MRRFLMVAGILIAALLLGFVLWYGPWTAGWFSSKAWQFQESRNDGSENLRQKVSGHPLGVYPVIAEGRLMGGVIDGQWRGRTEVAQRLNGRELYRIYSRQRFLGETVGGQTRKEEYLSGDTGFFIDNKQFFNGQAFGLAGDWNPFPREISILKDYTQLMPPLESWLMQQNDQTEGFRIEDAVVVDLEGDGQRETILVATNVEQQDIDGATEGQMEEGINRASYALLFRTGQKIPLVLAKAVEGINKYEIPFVADVDGDGLMEIKIVEININSVPVEGFALCTERIIKIRGQRIETMAEINSNPV